MTRDEAITQGVAAITEGTKSALGQAYDAGLASAPPVVPPSADVKVQIDAAVQAKATQDATALAAVQSQLDAVTAQDATDKALAESLQKVVDQVRAILAPKA